jgi:hypothetical protein
MYHAKMKSFYVLLVVVPIYWICIKYKIKTFWNQENAIMHL